jgi:hypothetical protein
MQIVSPHWHIMNIVYKNIEFKIRTFDSIETENNADLVVTDENEITKKTIFEIVFEGKQIVLVVFWDGSYSGSEICFHWAEESKFLFVGAGTLSAVVNISTLELVDINYPFLFWSWETLGDNILELGELACRLYTRKGKLIGEVAVDPPYDYVIMDHAIEFSSIVYGKARIEF